ncbi:MAG: hypothetical protein N4A61_15780 [Pelagimonas sp.]|jgi:hypothetical protein|nr:hypothetical protein [Pelagimonas sp.]
MNSIRAAHIRAARHSREEFGMLCGLASDFPDGYEMAIFKHALRCWPDFMDHAKLEIETALALRAADDDPFHPEALSDHTLTTARRYRGREHKLSLRVYQRPLISFLRAYWPVAVELFIDHQQFQGGRYPDRIWHHWSVCAEPTS